MSIPQTKTNCLIFIKNNYLFFTALLLITAVFFIFSCQSAAAAGPTYVYDDINQPTVWTKEGSPYVVGIDPDKRGLIINSHLTIEPGVVVKFIRNPTTNFAVYVSIQGSEGKLIIDADGQEPVVFTSYFDNDYDSSVGTEDDPKHGDWGSMYFWDDNSEISNVIIRYSNRHGHGSLVFSNNSQTRFTNSTVEYGRGDALVAKYNSKPFLDNLILNNYTGIGLNIMPDAGAGQLSNSVIKDNNNIYGMRISADSLFTFENNQYLSQLMCLWGSTNRHVTWYNFDLPYNVQGGIEIEENGIVHMEPGIIIQFDGFSASSTRMEINGELHANGTLEKPIIFTSSVDNPVYDDDPFSIEHYRWGELVFKNSSAPTSTLDYTEVRYGGKYHDDRMHLDSHNALIYIENSKVDIKNSIIRDSNTNGIKCFTDCALSIIDSQVSGHKGGIYIAEDTSFLPIIKNNSIFGNSDYGLSYEGSQPLDARYNWWGSASGPTHPDNPDGSGDAINGNVIFEPWLNQPPVTPAADIAPVILIPGIMGSYLNRDDGTNHEIWTNLDAMLFSHSDDYLNELIMTPEGLPNLDNPLIIPSDIIRDTYFSDYWDGLIDELENNGYTEGENLFVFPYDWRLNIAWTAGDSPMSYVETLNEKVEQIKNQTGTSKINIIAHSMGGLLSKYYFKQYGTNSINQFIDIGTPHLGAPKAFKILMYGDNIDIPILNPLRTKHISQNMPAVYQLLPSQQYFDKNQAEYSYYIADIHDLDENGIKGSLDFNQSIEFMENTGRNDYLLTYVDNLHSLIDEYSPKIDNIPTYNIIGSGNPTIGQIYVLNQEKSGGYEYGLKYINGDSTVPFRSANYFLTDKSYYYSGKEHAQLPSADGIKQLIVSILKQEQDSFDFSSYANLSPNQNEIELFSGTQISFHSPIEIHIYDELSNHLGPDENGDIEYGIIGAHYDIIEGNKFIFLPLGHTYTVIGQAEQSGLFNSRIQDIVDGNYVQTVYFNEVPLESENTNIKLQINDEQEDFAIKLDQDGDNVFESQVEPSSVLDEQESQDFEKPETTTALAGQIGSNNWYISDVTVELSSTDNENGSGILKTEYSLDNGSNWQIYSQTVALNQEGEHQLLYSATDRAGNREAVKELIIKIDKSNPDIEFIVPKQNDFFLRSQVLQIEYSLLDLISGIDNSQTKVWFDNQDITDNLEIDLFNYNLGAHTLTIYAHDFAGNSKKSKITFEIGANIDSTIADVNRLYEEGDIYYQFVRDKIIYKLNQANQYIDLYNQTHRSRLLAAISRQMQIISTELFQLHRQMFISDKAYDIIKEDIEYILNDLLSN